MPYDRHREPVNLITHLATLRWFATPTGQGYTCHHGTAVARGLL